MNLFKSWSDLSPRALQRHSLISALLLIVWSAPMWTGLMGRIAHHSRIFSDYQEIACAAERRLHHLPLYGAETTCPGLLASPYVYPPWVADGLAPALQLLGRGPLLALYTVAFLTAAAALAWFAVGRPLRGVTFRQRLPYLGFLSGGPLAFGNIAFLAHASAYAAAAFAGADSLVFTVVVAGFAFIKPVYLVLFTLTAYASAPLWRRGALILGGSFPPLVFSLSGGADMAQWRQTVAVMMNGADKGGGITGVISLLGVHDPIGSAGLYLAYAVPVFLSGLWLAERGGLDREARLWLGVSVAILIFPRLMGYDVAVIGPGLLALAAARQANGALWGDAPSADGTARSGPVRRLEAYGLAACGLCYIATLGGGLIHKWRELAYMMLAAGVVYQAVQLARAQRGASVSH